MIKAIVIAIVLTIVIGAYACALGWLGIKSAEWEEAHPRPKKRKKSYPWTEEQYNAYIRTGNRSYLCGKEVED